MIYLTKNRFPSSTFCHARGLDAAAIIKSAAGENFCLYTVKKGYSFPRPSRDVTNQTLHGWE
jgi:hypothetical protein